MKYWKLIPAVLMVLFVAGSSQAEEKSAKEAHAEKVKTMEDAFWAASKAGKIVKGVIIEGNSFFNGTTAPQEKPYTEEELLAAKTSAERNSQIFILAEDGTLYFPTPRKGESVTQSSNSPRMPRVLTEEQKKEGMFTWSTLVPLVGRTVELHGEIYPGYAGVKGLHIKSIYFVGEYLVEDD